MSPHETDPAPDNEGDELAPESTGRWVISTRGTAHILDLAARTYERRPGPTSHSFPHDNEPMTLLRVDSWPVVGQQMLVWFDDSSGRFEHYRVCSTIASIRPDRRADYSGS